MEYLTLRGICETWEVSERFVQQHCIEGRVEGARKFNKSWMIPAPLHPMVREAVELVPTTNRQAKERLGSAVAEMT